MVVTVTDTPGRGRPSGSPTWPFRPCDGAGPEYVACWPLMLPPTLTRSVGAPGAAWRRFQGSRPAGIGLSSEAVTVDADPAAAGALTAAAPLKRPTPGPRPPSPNPYPPLSRPTRPHPSPT